MADIRVTCPACKTQLEIGAEFEGQEVECGTCLEVFTASTKKTKPKGDDPDKRSESGGGKIKGSTSKTRSSRDRDDDDDDDDRPARRRRDEDDDDDDYDHDHGPSRRKAGGSQMPVMSLVLGILSVLCLLGSCFGGTVIPIAGCCCGLGSLGSSIAAIITGAIGIKTPEGKGMATAGLVLGGLTLLAIIVLFVIGFVIGFGGAMNGGPPNRVR